MSAPDGAGTREVARRLFAAEYDDATHSYSESDEERAPNYVVSPTGARVNRLFAVGVLTATESVNEDMLRARIVDPTGAFVAYAGQYQPDSLAFFERTTPPAFVALTAKARTFQPEDSEQVFTSARPETVNEVDADTRDRWTVSAAKATLRRVSLFDAALSSGLRGDELEAHLRDHGVEEALAAGVPRAIDHYGTTTAYLDAVRQLALDALAVVAGEREEVRELTVAPDEGGPEALGPIPDALRADAAITTPETVPSESAPAASAPQSPVGATSEATESSAAEVSPSEATESSPTESSPSEATESSPSETTGEATPETTAESPSSEAAESSVAERSDTTPAAESESTLTATGDSTTGDSATESATADPSAGDSAPETGTTASTSAGDELGDFDESLADDTPPSTDDESDSASGDAGTADADVDVAQDEIYEFDEEEREAVREEHGLSFESGADVGEPGEAEIDTPDVPEPDDESVAVEETATESTTAETTAEPTLDKTTTESDLEETTTESDRDETAESTPTETAAESTAATTDEPATAGQADEADPDLTDVVVEAMDELDEGDGADREEVIAVVVQRHDVDPGDVDDAIQEALMDGKCYEPGEDRLKAI